MSMPTMANRRANFVVTISFLTLLNAISDSGTFFLFAALTVVALVYFIKRVPETKGLLLQEIERQLAWTLQACFRAPLTSRDALAVHCSIRGGKGDEPSISSGHSVWASARKEP